MSRILWNYGLPETFRGHYSHFVREHSYGYLHGPAQARILIGRAFGDPFFERLEKVQAMLDTLYTHTNVDEGFSLTGKQNGVLACHNALCTSIYIRAGKKEWAVQGIQWIISYFPFEKDEPSTWHGNDLFHRFGGCVGKSPCYDGVVKSVKVLSEYRKNTGSFLDFLPNYSKAWTIFWSTVSFSIRTTTSFYTMIWSLFFIPILIERIS